MNFFFIYWFKHFFVKKELEKTSWSFSREAFIGTPYKPHLHTHTKNGVVTLFKRHVLHLGFALFSYLLQRSNQRVSMT